MEKKKEKPNNEFRSLLERVCQDLVYISETDAPVAPVFGKRNESLFATPMPEAAGAKPKNPLVVADADDFFKRLTTEKEWFGSRQKKNARGFSKLEKILKKELRDLKVFRVGNINIDIYVLGIDKDGKVVGVKTRAVET
ncbi:MAG: nuclease A inhibitor family protein [Pyrinomonadaceae bacterium]